MNEEISIKELVELISDITNINIEIETDSQRVRPTNSEVDRLKCDNKKLIENTNWKPNYNLKKGLAETIDWIEKNKKLFKHNIYNR